MLSCRRQADIEDKKVLLDIVVFNKTITQVFYPRHLNITSIGNGMTGEEYIEVDPLVLALKFD